MSPKQQQAVSCPTCGSGPKIMCKLSSGQPRKSAHRDRRLVAAEFWKTHPTAIEWLDWHFAIARCPSPSTGHLQYRGLLEFYDVKTDVAS